MTDLSDWMHSWSDGGSRHRDGGSGGRQWPAAVNTAWPQPWQDYYTAAQTYRTSAPVTAWREARPDRPDDMNHTTRPAYRTALETWRDARPAAPTRPEGIAPWRTGHNSTPTPTPTPSPGGSGSDGPGRDFLNRLTNDNSLPSWLRMLLGGVGGLVDLGGASLPGGGGGTPASTGYHGGPMQAEINRLLQAGDTQGLAALMTRGSGTFG